MTPARLPRTASPALCIALGISLLALGSSPVAAAERSSDEPVPPKGEAAAAPAAAPGGGAVQGEGGSRGMLLQGTSDQPLSIQSEELEAIEENGGRKLVFTRSVEVQQGDLSVRSQRLEAFYPKGAEQPDRLVASGQVRVRQGTRELSCNRATFFQGEERLLCVGSARLREGENQVRGEQIEIFFDQDRIRVKGGAVVNVTPRQRAEAAPTASGGGERPR